MDVFYEPLTPREREILLRIADSQTNREIGLALHLAEATIRWHNTQIFGKLGVKTRSEAVTRAQQLRLLDQAPTPNHNLPRQLSTFVGRHQEMREVAHLIGSDTVRLISLLGAGGIGKTHLALEVARNHLSRFADGAWFVPLATNSSVEQITTNIADRIGLQLHNESPPQAQLLAFLAKKHMLLVLDNFEHLLDAAPLVSEIIRAAPQVKVLVTTREKLNLSMETVLTLTGLPFPDEENFGDALDYDAVTLLIQSAQRVRRDFSPQADELVDLARICNLTAGMPLALVLAASWLDMLTPEQIAAALQRGIDILESEMRDLPERQRSVRATIDYSWSRLSATERDIFMKLSVFRGGFTTEAARVVAGASLRHLRTLIDQSLVQALPNGRCDIHEMLRQYSAERLASDSGVAQFVADSHSTFYLGFVAQREADVKGRRQRSALDEIDADFENVRTAWDRALDRADWGRIGDAVEGLSVYLGSRRRWKDQEALILKAIHDLAPTGDQMPNPDWGKIVVCGPYSKELMGQTEIAFAIARQQEDKAQIGRCLLRIGLLISLGTMDQVALRLVEESVDYFREEGDSFYLAGALFWAGLFYRLRAKGQVALVYIQQSLNLRSTIGDKLGLALSISELGMVRFVMGNLEEAERYKREAYRIAKEEQASHGMWLGIDYGGIFVLGKQGNLREARSFIEEGFNSAPELAASHLSRMNRALALNFLSLIESMDDNYDRARALGEQARVIASGDPWEPMYRWGLLAAVCGQQDYASAVVHIRFFLQHFMEWRVNTWLLVGVAFAAVVNAYRDHAAPRAAELLALVFSHPHSLSGWLHVWSLVKELQQELRTELGHEQYQAAWERGKLLDLETVVRDLLANLQA